ncbi:hypothetical protein GO491_08365 [Flavobacteriaceae bacterium Ap0902]|nr:hypothetical protein [Flavobacteriaceae bacterium Ap0902]
MNSTLLKPFAKYSEKTLLAVGITGTLIGSYLAYIFNVRFDGVLDLHTVSDALYHEPFIDNLINIICLILLLFVTAKYINVKTRLVDMVNTVLIARMPYYLLTVFNLNDFINKATLEVIEFTNTQQVNDIPIFNLAALIIFALLSILFLIWYITLLFNGFKIASNAKDKRSIFLFIAAILLSEIISKILIHQFN